jgi:hypothetical protein
MDSPHSIHKLVVCFIYTSEKQGNKLKDKFFEASRRSMQEPAFEQSSHQLNFGAAEAWN